MARMHVVLVGMKTSRAHSRRFEPAPSNARFGHACMGFHALPCMLVATDTVCLLTELTVSDMLVPSRCASPMQGRRQETGAQSHGACASYGRGAHLCTLLARQGV